MEFFLYFTPTRKKLLKFNFTKSLTLYILISGGGLIALFGAHLIHYDGAGGLATIIMAFVAGMQWRKEGWGDHNPVTKTFKRMWIILEPVIFALIGTEIQIDKIDPNSLGKYKDLYYYILPDTCEIQFYVRIFFTFELKY